MPRGKRRAHLLHAAREVFVQHGYHAAAMDEIAVRAGVSKPVLYQHFPGKLDLYLALVDTAIDELLGRLQRALASTDDNKQRVIATVAAYFEFVDDQSGFYRLLFESDLANDPAVRGRLDRLTQLCSAEISAIIAEDTGLSREESDLLAVGLVGIAQVTARYWLSVDGNIEKEKAAELVASLGWRGIRGFPLTHEHSH
ncbi:TetR/AcrR family transcriptional regulator [Phytoactinopolyspora halotolerans]|uniref:TetR/AcrR family transcriptional regulator n=2 Tax=Phytoactinopolyspora halotolerans TaxID=1981512 RepID=A0A6L9SI62_9ACTN|nr:TetR/AcrR family transcriptional regulator [Phytoactinopolyspora halotolerans]